MVPTSLFSYKISMTIFTFYGDNLGFVKVTYKNKRNYKNIMPLLPKPC